MKNAIACSAFAASLLTTVVGLSGAPVSAAEDNRETPREIIADHILVQGYPCQSALHAERDIERSKPHEAVWTLKCQDATYRVRLIPDMAAQVERLE